MRSDHSGLKITRAHAILPEITPSRPAQQKAKPHDRILTMDGDPGNVRRSEISNVDAVKREEFGKGVLEGKRSAEQALKADYEKRLELEHQRVESLLTALNEQLLTIQSATEQALIKFAFGIAEKIIRKEIGGDRQIVVEQIKEGVRRVVGVENIRVRIHPEDLPLVREQKSVIQGSGDAIREIVVDGDETLEPGDCIIESDMGNIDARVATQLRQIEMVLFEGRLGL